MKRATAAVVSALLLLTGCSTRATSVTAFPLHASAYSPLQVEKSALEAKPEVERLVYVSDHYRGTVSGYNRAGTPTIVLKGLLNPIGLDVDASHNVLVADSGAGNVQIFAQGATEPFKTLDDPGQMPVDIAVCPSARVYVANFVAKGQTGQGNIAVYEHGRTKATSWLHDPREIATYSVACDAHENIFAIVVYSWTPLTCMAEKYVRGKQTRLVKLPLVKLESPFFSQLKTIGPNILVNDQDSRTAIEYTEDGQPTGRAMYEEPMAVGIAVSRDGKVVLAAGGGEDGGAESFLFPSGVFRHAYVVQNSNEPWGVAFDPGPVRP